MNLSYLNSLIFKEPSHKISSLKPHDKNLELKVIILDKVETVLIKNKQSTIHKFLIADQSGSMFMNLFDEKGPLFLSEALSFNRLIDYRRSSFPRWHNLLDGSLLHSFQRPDDPLRRQTKHFASYWRLFFRFLSRTELFSKNLDPFKININKFCCFLKIYIECLPLATTPLRNWILTHRLSQSFI